MEAGALPQSHLFCLPERAAAFVSRLGRREFGLLNMCQGNRMRTEDLLYVALIYGTLTMSEMVATRPKVSAIFIQASESIG